MNGQWFSVLCGWVLLLYLIHCRALFCSTVEIFLTLFSNVALGEFVLPCVLACCLRTVIQSNERTANSIATSL